MHKISNSRWMMTSIVLIWHVSQYTLALPSRYGLWWISRNLQMVQWSDRNDNLSVNASYNDHKECKKVRLWGSHYFQYILKFYNEGIRMTNKALVEQIRLCILSWSSKMYMFHQWGSWALSRSSKCKEKMAGMTPEAFTWHVSQCICS